MPELLPIPLAEIDAGALTRDRLGLDAEAQAELERSIAASGLRHPVEARAARMSLNGVTNTTAVQNLVGRVHLERVPSSFATPEIHLRPHASIRRSC